MDIREDRKPESNNSPNPTKSTQVSDTKSARREQRRNLRASGDFLGVQGANPRTGYPDPSASSTETSHISEETKRKLVQLSEKVEEQRSRLHEAELQHQADLIIIQRSREAKRGEREERKKNDDIMRQQRIGRWKPDSNGWSSFIEPQLSPIVQS
jgi:hypothetical protein